eukprot:gene9068-biopygen14986
MGLDRVVCITVSPLTGGWGIPHLEVWLDASDVGWGVVLVLPTGRKMTKAGVWSASQASKRMDVREAWAVGYILQQLCK